MWHVELQWGNLARKSRQNCLMLCLYYFSLGQVFPRAFILPVAGKPCLPFCAHAEQVKCSYGKLDSFSCIAGYALLWAIHHIQFKIIYHVNPNLHTERLGTVDRQYPAYLLDLRHPPPPTSLVATSPRSVGRCGNGDH